MRWARKLTSTGKKGSAYKVLVGNPEVQTPLGRPRHRWEGNIKMDLKEIGWEDMDWMYFAPDRDQWRAHVDRSETFREILE
jgi:hypothetical protein